MHLVVLLLFEAPMHQVMQFTAAPPPPPQVYVPHSETTDNPPLPAPNLLSKVHRLEPCLPFPT